VAALCAILDPARYLDLMLEHHNARLFRNSADAQWNDGVQNVLCALLTGNDRSCYADYAEDPAAKLVHVPPGGSVCQRELPADLGGPRGEPSADLPSQAHVLFLQNHDRMGNRGLVKRLTMSVSAGVESVGAKRCRRGRASAGDQH
jgi:maltooligosyltrehalose trehalohydrolase